MRRLLLLTERFPPDLGGVATSAGRLAQRFNELGVAVEVVTWSRFLPAGQVQVKVLSEQLRCHAIGQYRQWDMTMPYTVNLLDGLHQETPIDAVWGHYLFPSGFLAVWWGKLKGVPTVVSARGNDIDRLTFPPGDFARLQWTITQATVVTAVSQDLAKKAAVLHERSVQVLPNVVDGDLFSPRAIDAAQMTVLKQELGIWPEEMVLGFCGELRVKKGQQYLLDALVKVQAVRSACLLIIGEGRSETEALLQQFALTHPAAAERVIMTGHLTERSQIAQYLNLCDLYLQPSLWEGMPNALLEAMACERVCIASDAGGIAEVIVSEQNGFLLPRMQLEHLGEAILEVLELSIEQRREISRSARESILHRHHPDLEKAALAEIIQLIAHKSD